MTLDEAIEQIDIGGPTMVRAAAKNHAFTTIATDHGSTGEILDQIRAHGCTTLELRRKLAGEAFAHTALYDRAIADFFAGATAEGRFPGTVTWASSGSRCCATARIRISKAALYARPEARAPAWSPPGNSTARSFPTTTSSISTVPWPSSATSAIRPRW